MATEVFIRYDTSRRPADRDAYQVWFVETDNPPHPMRRVGEVTNDVVAYHGIYASRAAAETAAQAYVKGSA